MIGHIIGIDSAGHTVGPFHKELERKIKDTNRILEQIIEKMDKHTTLIVFGDHGMTNNGDHGGSSELELRTIFFAY
jgi:phosphatidylinositol glycan class O